MYCQISLWLTVKQWRFQTSNCLIIGTTKRLFPQPQNYNAKIKSLLTRNQFWLQHCDCNSGIPASFWAQSLSIYDYVLMSHYALACINNNSNKPCWFGSHMMLRDGFFQGKWANMFFTVGCFVYIPITEKADLLKYNLVIVRHNLILLLRSIPCCHRASINQKES